MKKITGIVLAAALAVAGLASCNKICPCDYCQGLKGNESGNATNMQILYFSVKSSNWTLYTPTDGTNAFYYASLDIPELTSDIMDQGLITAYVYFDGSQEQLPYVRHYEEYYTVDGTEYQYLWTQTVDAEFYEGGANVYCTMSDFYTDEAPEDMDFRVVLLWI